jgi:hypothetical protein
MLLAAVTLQMGCANLLPSGKAMSESAWKEYANAREAFDKIEVGKTTEDDLKQLGYDVKTSPNVKILNYLDITAQVQSIPLQELDPGLQACIRARAGCRAYVFEPTRIYSKRVGNFWLDLLNFRRKTHETGWRYKALIVFVNHHVCYKLSSGEPKVDTWQDQINPLGPFQSATDMVTGLLKF